MSNELWRWSATDLAAGIQTKHISSREVVQAHLDRIEQVNGSINAVTAVLSEGALAAADAADAVAPDQMGPLHGVPITIKESIDVAGTPTTFGVVKYRNSMPEQDAPIISHLKSAGAIVIGRTNMPDYGMRWHTDNELHGPTLNPWDFTRTPGGSSGGEGAALATGMSPLGIGNDMGGSTRQPAVNCGVAGLRPTTGRVSRVMSRIFDDPPMFYEQVACVNGPMARRVCDLRLALSVMQHPDPTDPTWVPATAPPGPETRARRVGLVRDPFGRGVAPAVDNALNLASRYLEQSGYHVDEVDPPMVAEVDEAIQVISETEIGAYLEDTIPTISKDAAAVLCAVVGDAKPDADRYRDAIASRFKVAQAWASLMDRYPLILGAVSTMEAFPVGYDTGGGAVMRRLIESFWLTELCNLVGLPSVALPACVENGLPQGVQVIGRRFDEGRCFDAAEVIEQGAKIATPIDPVVKA